MRVRMFYATDVHGSEVCWRKFINCAKFYEADVLVLGGDMTGKAVVPIVSHGSGRFQFSIQDQRYDFDTAALSEHEKLIKDHGYYPVQMTREEVEGIAQSPAELDSLFDREMRHAIEDWVAFADERLSGTGIQCIVCPGNDDRHDIDEILAGSECIQVGEGNVLDLPGGHQMASTGWSNPTPWDTPREEDDALLRVRIDQVVAQATVPPERLVLSLHAPPYDTQLDVAPKISWEDLRVQGQEVEHVGSRSVRAVIEEVQPLLSLHGHIHESRAVIRLGRTLAINPGSSYDQGLLLGCVVDLEGKDRVKRYKLTTG